MIEALMYGPNYKGNVRDGLVYRKSDHAFPMTNNTIDVVDFSRYQTPKSYSHLTL
jgi:hypothetical protein